MLNDCSKVVESYLLYQNPLYAFSLPISLIIAIIVYGICISMKCTSNSYMLQIIIPILTIMIVNVVIEFISRIMLNKNEINDLTKTCIQYLEKAEHFENEDDKNKDEKNKEVIHLENKMAKMPQVESIHSPLKVVDNIYHGTYQVINNDSTPYMLPFNGLNTANNCPIG